MGGGRKVLLWIRNQIANFQNAVVILDYLQSEHNFIAYSCTEGRSWKEMFINMHKEYGRYISCYRKIKGTWNKLEKYLEGHCPSILQSLQGECRKAYLFETTRPTAFDFWYVASPSGPLPSLCKNNPAQGVSYSI